MWSAGSTKSSPAPMRAMRLQEPRSTPRRHTAPPPRSVAPWLCPFGSDPEGTGSAVGTQGQSLAPAMHGRLFRAGGRASGETQESAWGADGGWGCAPRPCATPRGLTLRRDAPARRWSAGATVGYRSPRRGHQCQQGSPPHPCLRPCVRGVVRPMRTVRALPSPAPGRRTAGRVSPPRPSPSPSPGCPP